MENRDLPDAGEQQKRAYVYCGYPRQNNYIQCYDGRINAHDHYPQWHSNRQGRNASVTQRLCNGGA